MAALGTGIGDMVVIIPILQSLIAQRVDTTFVSKSERQNELASLIPGLHKIVPVPSFDPALIKMADIYIDFQTNEIVQRAALSSEVSNHRPQINELLADACERLQIDVDFTVLIPLAHKSIQEAVGKIILIPGTTSDSKTWPLPYWLELQEYLSKKGEICALLGEPATSPPVRELQESGLKLIPTPTMVDVLNAVSSAKVVISVDTGAMHLAVNQGVNTISFFNYNSFWRRDYHNSFALITEPCQPECVEYGRLIDECPSPGKIGWCEGRTWSEDSFYFCRVSEEERCIASISPQLVIAMLEENRLLE
jgi:ADP-heptose:LPS heptosyltransferase